jgi:hypothetical protein
MYEVHNLPAGALLENSPFTRLHPFMAPNTKARIFIPPVARRLPGVMSRPGLNVVPLALSIDMRHVRLLSPVLQICEFVLSARFRTAATNFNEVPLIISSRLARTRVKGFI